MFQVKLINGRTLRLSLEELEIFLQEHGSQVEVQKHFFRPRDKSNFL